MTESDIPTPPGLFLILDTTRQDNGIAELDAASASAPVEVILIRSCSEMASEEIMKSVISAVQSRDIAALVEDNIDMAKTLAADGVHLNSDSLAEFSRAVDQLEDSQMIIGTTASLSRDAAMTLAEDGCTYMAINSNNDGEDNGDTQEEYRRPPTLEWWVTLFETPVVAWQLETLDEVSTATSAGADFIALAPNLWQKGEETGQIMTTIIETMNSAIQNPETSA